MGLSTGQNQSGAEDRDKGTTEKGSWLTPEVIPKGKGALLPEAERQGCARAPLKGRRGWRSGRPAVLAYCLGKAKSQAVSCAHFHMACMRRVKPMSLGFSRPLISRCFMMETNSLLLSSPLPRGRSKHNR